MPIIPLIMDEDLVKLGEHSFIDLHLAVTPHIVIFGSTGSGKTYFCKQLLGRISLYESAAQIYVCDFKGDSDFSFLRDCDRFYRFNECSAGLEVFYNNFQERQSGKSTTRHILLLYFDEWASYLNSLDDKKLLESEKKKLSNLLMLGRSFSCHIILSQQRVDAQYFGTARDNFNIVIGLGNLSKESQEMFFHNYRKEIKPDRKRGTGYMLTNGTNLQKVIVPAIRNMDKLHEIIKTGVIREK